MFNGRFMRNLLAFDTGTEWMSIAVQKNTQQWHYQGEGVARSSAELIPRILDLLQQADLPLRDVEAICFGNGPGSFTGLRTACSVAQGLALGADIPVLPIDSLLAVAEEARFNAFADQTDQTDLTLTAILDARMDERYVGTYTFHAGIWTVLEAPRLIKPDAFTPLPHAKIVGNIAPATVSALPTAAAMLRLADQMLAQGLAVAAEHAQPLYIRDKVAQTTAERLAAKNHASTL